MSLDLSSFGSAIVGGLIAGSFALIATWLSFKNQESQADKKEKYLIKCLLQAINDEIEAVYERYKETMGARIESLNDGDLLNFYYPLESDFFSVYNGNAILISRIPDDNLRKQIIKTYTLAKGMMDSIRLNNDFVQKQEDAHKTYHVTNDPAHKMFAEEHTQVLIEYAKTMKGTHQKMKQEIENLLCALQKPDVLSDGGN